MLPSKTTTSLEAVHDLIRRGFEVFPVKAGAKKPPLLKDFPARSAECAARVEDWWGGAKANRNIGLHCRGLLVVDVDPRHGGYQSLLQLELAEELPPTLEFSTPSGGRHLVYAAPQGSRNTVGQIAPGIDTRGTGGYIVAPGSVTSDGAYAIREDRPVAQAPEWLLRAVRVPERPQEPVSPPPKDTDQDLAVERALSRLAQHPPAVEGQGGDAHTFATVCLVRDLGVAEDRAAEALEAWNATCEPPWDPDDLTAKIHNAYRYAQNAPGTRSVEAMFDLVDPAATPPAERADDEEMYSPDDVTLDSVLESSYLVKGWLDHGSQALLFGHWGAGKTFIALHLAAHLASNQPWFGNRVTQGGVLYCGYEGPRSLRRRVYALRREFADWDLSRFRLRPMRWPLARRNADGTKLVGQQKLESTLKRFKEDVGAYPALVIIDPLRNALGGSDSDPDLTAPFLAYLQRLTKATGCAVLVVHHPGHGDSERGRGDSGIEAAMDTVIKVDGDRGRIESRKQRDDPKGTLYYRLRTVAIGVDTDGDPRTTCVVEAVDPNPLDPSLTDTQQRVYDQLKELVGEEGKVTKGQFNRAAEGHAKNVRDEILEALLQKQYLVADGRAFRIGAGAAEMFS